MVIGARRFPRCHPSFSHSIHRCAKNMQKNTKPLIPSGTRGYSRVATHVALRPTFAAIPGGTRHDSSSAAPRRNHSARLPVHTTHRLSEKRNIWLPCHRACLMNLFLIISVLLRVVKCIFARNNKFLTFAAQP